MAKLKNIIRQLAQDDFESIYQDLAKNNAEKSAYLLKYIYQEQLSDSKIMKELNVNTNAYYTLRSRLNQKIEEYLLQQIESPRTDVLRKVANINEIIFTKKRTIAIATLKKLEKELLDYDLSNELMLVYKTLKKLHINTPEYFEYSQFYNQHVAYTLDVDKVEFYMAEYFKKYGTYSFTFEETEKTELILLNQQIVNICKKYSSRRLYVYQSCVNVFHRLFVEAEDEMIDDSIEPIEDIFTSVEQTFTQYGMDSIYFHLGIVFQYLRLEYYNHYKLYRKAEKFFDEVNDSSAALLSSYNMFTYPARFLFTKLERNTRANNLEILYEENQGLFIDFEADLENTPQYVTYVCYRAICQFYAGKYEEGVRWLNKLLNDVSLKRFPYVNLEIKLFLGVLYVLVKDEELLTQLLTSLQRQIRLLSKETCIHAVLIAKLLKISMQANKIEKEERIKTLFEKIKKTLPKQTFCVTKYLRFDDELLNKII
ncbi:MAG: hypothetical protein EAZ44_07770 [Cytophagia bacterium]|nr:MAG: hypothetical protein EAZ44_07770 [Cytophagia bacterium]TAG42548.1 MAG: hypothetical protein EAZ31_05910 [Cytophagia bacterium]TAH28987.1 MAG: hypothetical protein EAZ06_08305 [Cytophagales bacterium]